MGSTEGPYAKRNKRQGKKSNIRTHTFPHSIHLDFQEQQLEQLQMQIQQNIQSAQEEPILEPIINVDIDEIDDKHVISAHFVAQQDQVTCHVCCLGGERNSATEKMPGKPRTETGASSTTSQRNSIRTAEYD